MANETTTTGAFQQRLTQTVAPEIDASSADDHGEDEAQTTMDALTTKGYFGHTPEDEQTS